MPRVKVDDVELFYVEEGSGDILVLIHGLGGDHTEWATYIPVFAERFRVIAVDLRGHGESEKKREYSFPIFAKDVIGLLDKLGIDKAYFCGVSMGGGVVIQIALSYPQRVKGLILVNAAVRVTEQSVKVVSKWFELFQREGFESYFDQMVKDVFTPSFVEANWEIIEQIREMCRCRDMETVINVAIWLRNFDFVNQLSKISAPTLIIHGGGDKVIPVGEARILHEKIRNSKLVVFPDCGHATLVEKVQKFSKTVLEFLENLA